MLKENIFLTEIMGSQDINHTDFADSRRTNPWPQTVTTWQEMICNKFIIQLIEG
jgi:hypothetical protein